MNVTKIPGQPCGVFPQRRLCLLVMGGMLMSLLLGCGNDENGPSEPGSDIAVMGLTRTKEDGRTTALLVVSKDGALIEDATAEINGTALLYSNYRRIYYSDSLPVTHDEDVTLSVRSTVGNKELHATVPGQLTLFAPSESDTFLDSESIVAQWNQPEGAQRYQLLLYDDDVNPDYLRELPAGTSSHTIPDTATTTGWRTVGIEAFNGAGMMPPMHAGEWVSLQEDGFWAVSDDCANVRIEDD